MSRAGLHMPQIVFIERNKRIFSWDHPQESRKYGLSPEGTKDSGGTESHLGHCQVRATLQHPVGTP